MLMQVSIECDLNVFFSLLMYIKISLVFFFYFPTNLFIIAGSHFSAKSPPLHPEWVIKESILMQINGNITNITCESFKKNQISMKTKSDQPIFV